jgi:hypothetical protein
MQQLATRESSMTRRKQTIHWLAALVVLGLFRVTGTATAQVLSKWGHPVITLGETPYDSTNTGHGNYPGGQRRERFWHVKNRGLRDLGYRSKSQTPTPTTENASVVLGVWQNGQAKGCAETGEANNGPAD